MREQLEMERERQRRIFYRRYKMIGVFIGGFFESMSLVFSWSFDPSLLFVALTSVGVLIVVALFFFCIASVAFTGDSLLTKEESVHCLVQWIILAGYLTFQVGVIFLAYMITFFKW